jgi:hypothetical protein
MNINRHNYEEYFILYADNELGSDEHRMVEDFVSANPDLKDELDVFINSILLPDISVTFGNKEELHRYDEALISYIDNELPADDKMKLEELINSSPKLQQELNLYRKTQLQPDTDIIFENKSVLYRSTEKRRVVPIRVLRWAAAAAILLAVSITAVNLLNRNPDITDGTTAGTKEELKNNEPAVANNNNLLPLAEKTPQQDIIAKTPVKQKPVLPNDKKAVPELAQQAKKDEVAVNTNQQFSNNLPLPENKPYLKNDTKSPNDAVAVHANPGVTADNDSKTDPAVTNLSGKPLDNKAAYASLTEINTDEESGKNKKSRGFFRKVTRLFEKNTGIKATDDDKLRIAAFTVKLK